MNDNQRRIDHAWHVALNKFNQGKTDFHFWMYRAKEIYKELPRLTLLFKMERTDKLRKIHYQCSHSSPEQIKDNHLTCCLGVKCRDCKFLKALDVAEVSDDERDEIRAYTCVGHILQECGKNYHGIDTSEGFILTEDDRMYWDNVYRNMATYPDNRTDSEDPE